MDLNTNNLFLLRANIRKKIKFEYLVVFTFRNFLEIYLMFSTFSISNSKQKYDFENIF